MTYHSYLATFWVEQIQILIKQKPAPKTFHFVSFKVLLPMHTQNHTCCEPSSLELLLGLLGAQYANGEDTDCWRPHSPCSFIKNMQAESLNRVYSPCFSAALRNKEEAYKERVSGGP